MSRTVTASPPIAGLKASLTADERRVLVLLSVLYAPTPVTGIIAAFERLTLAPRFSPTIADLRSLLEGLERKKLVEVKNTRWSCRPEVVELATRAAVHDGQLDAMARIVPERKKVRKPDFRIYGRPRPDEQQASDEALRDLRIAVYQHDVKRFAQILANDADPWFGFREVHPFVQIALTPFDPAWMDALPARIRDGMLLTLYSAVDNHSAFASWLERYLISHHGAGLGEVRVQVAMDVALGLRLDHAESILGSDASIAARGVRGFIYVTRGQHEAAVTEYEAGLESLRTYTGNKKETFTDICGMMYVVALLGCRKLEAAEKYIALIADNKRHPLRDYFKLWRLASTLVRGGSVEEVEIRALADNEPFRFLLYAAVRWWHNPDSAGVLIGPLKKAGAVKGQVPWLVAEYTELVGRMTGDKQFVAAARALHDAAGATTIFDAVAVQSPWERTLTALESLETPTSNSEPVTGNTRIVWFINTGTSLQRLQLSIGPREQKRTSKGWTSGRAVSLKRLFEDWKQMPYLTEADRAICASIVAYRSNYYGGAEYQIDTQIAVDHLIGHPLVFHEDDPTTRVEIVAVRPTLHVERVAEEMRLRFEPPMQREGPTIVVRSSRLIEVVRFNERERHLNKILGAECRVPASAEKRVARIVAELAGKVTVHAPGVTSGLEQRDADGRLQVHLTPLGEGLQARVWVQPVGPNGPLQTPGEGGASVVAEIDGRSVQVRRSLNAERAAVSQLQAAVPVESIDNGWDCPDPEQALELLAALEAAEVSVHWPEGEPFRIVRKVAWTDVRLKVTSDREWFVVGGDVPTDEARVISLAALLQQRRHGRFVALGKGDFVALSREMERRLRDLSSLTEVTADGLRVHPLSAPLVDEALEGGIKTADKKWRTHLARFRDVKDADVPSTLQAELRQYQVDGFRWLARLAQWGAGACLADDMGLGKTLQALALLLHRAADGPALVVAPTSVCANWMAEARRFAPTLKLTLHAGTTRDLGQPGPYDVVVTSYAILTQDEKLLSAQKWQTVVLDEAQAIKNATTQRSQAAMKLRAEFRMVATGTPIENHLTELWTLFRFLNPGLLGTREQFDARFTTPMERGEAEARQRLKRLITPFVLRRLKSQVLEELPSRTEVTLEVELSPRERVLYEALRRTAVESFAGKNKDPQQRVRIFAELMRLRRACCHPRLVKGAEDVSKSSSKLDVFKDVLDELIDNRHKALVFSQFVDHLAVIREYLDANHIKYQYLDGSTPMKEREKRVADFQRGEGDVFLISLRAGGSGLNLTAADYVIHLDPWWNPAVEDQASDRAHRIGQHRPVTIYRLVTRNTVEERIVDLHRHKRELAESLLEGTEGSARMTTDDLLALFAE